jgi:CRISPR/Cas system-associated exonuclease Cas4 (RecB family)
MYCEKQVDLWLDNPTSSRVSVPGGIEEVETPEVREERGRADERVELGEDFHSTVEQSAVAIEPAELQKRLRRGETLILLEHSLRGIYKGLPIIGRADALRCTGRRVSRVVEYKVTNTPRLFPSHQAQLRLYGFLLEQAGYDITNLTLICVFIPSSQQEWIASLSHANTERFLDQVWSAADKIIAQKPIDKFSAYGQVLVKRGIEVTLGVFPYKEEKTIEELDFAVSYWLGKRAPIPTKQAGKCARCLYNAIDRCTEALVPFSSTSWE